MPTAFTETFNTFRTTLQPEKIRSDVTDQVGQPSPGAKWLARNCLYKANGYRIEFPIKTANPSNTNFLASSQAPIPRVIPDNKTIAYYDWKDLATSVTFTHNDMTMARAGQPNVLFDIVTQGYFDAYKEVAETIATAFYASDGSTGSYANAPLGLVSIVDETKAATVGGISMSANSYWQCQALSVASFATYGFQQMHAMGMLVDRGYRGRQVGTQLLQEGELGGQGFQTSDVILTSETVAGYYAALAFSKGQFAIDKTSYVDLGMQGWQFGGRLILADKYCSPTDSMYYLNKDSINIIVQENNFMNVGELESVDLTGNKSAIIWTKYTVVSYQQRSLGQLFNVTA